jgi:hypothetical protein
MARAFFTSSWGSERLWLSRISTDDNRKQVVQQYTRGDVPDVDDRGNEPKIVRCSLLFDDLTGETRDPMERLESLIALKDTGKPQLFVHPIHGTFLAAIEQFTHSIDSTNTITAEATFVATEAVGAFAAVPIAITSEVDGSTINAAADGLTATLADVDLTSGLPDSAKAAGDVFDQANSARDVLVAVSSASDRLWSEIDELQAEADIELWPAFKAYVMLGEAVRAAGAATTGDVPLMTTRVDGPMSLIRLMAEIYGGAEAPDRKIEAMQLNDIPTPGRIPAGTQLRLRQPTARAA